MEALGKFKKGDKTTVRYRRATTLSTPGSILIALTHKLITLQQRFKRRQMKLKLNIDDMTGEFFEDTACWAL